MVVAAVPYISSGLTDTKLNLLKMFKLLIPILFGVATGIRRTDPATRQLAYFMNSTKVPIGILTTSAGSPVRYEDAEATLNKNLIDNDYMIDNLMEFLRERRPDRVVHANGNGAFGYFEATHNISHICKAKLFEVGKKTPVATRFSLGLSNGDPWRALRGFATKFYTEEGNFDLVGFNTPFFPFKDPIYFAHISHAVRRNPVTNIYDQNMFWDFFTSLPQVQLITLYLFSDIATPRGYHHMNGHGILTYEVTNEEGVKHMVRWHLIPSEGVKNFTSAEAKKVAAADPDFYTRDLYNRISEGRFPCWQLKIQVLTQEDVDKADMDIYDPTRDLPFDVYPPQPVGKLCLNRNPDNYFADVEELAFCPANLVPGILGSPAKLFEARRLAYKNAQLYRLGSNFNKIPVNCPLHAFTFIRNGVPPTGKNGGGAPNYFPNSFGGPEGSTDDGKATLSKITEEEPDNFDQARGFYLSLSSKEKSSLVDNLAISMCSTENFIKGRALETFSKVHSDLSDSLHQALMAQGCLDD